MGTSGRARTNNRASRPENGSAPLTILACMETQTMALEAVKLGWQSLSRGAIRRFWPKTTVQRALILTGTILVLFAAKEMHRVASDPSVSLWQFFKHDTLFPAAMYEDISADLSSLRDWR